MREIKFRGWYGEKIGMLTPTFNGDINEIFAVQTGVYMQYTGLKDKNGREIYESDIIRICDVELESEYIHEVVWGGEEYPAWDVKPYWDSECNVFSDIYNIPDYFTIEVIGNVYENSDLLK